MNNYYAPNGQADGLFNTIMLQQQFFQLEIISKYNLYTFCLIFYEK